MRHRKKRREDEIRRAMKKRAKKQAIGSGLSFGEKNCMSMANIEFLVQFLSKLHGNIFGSQLINTTENKPIKWALQTDNLVWPILLDPPADLIRGHTIPSNSMVFLSVSNGNFFSLGDGIITRGIYVINTPALEKFLVKNAVESANVDSSLLRAMELTSIAGIVAHEVRHEVYQFTHPQKKHKMCEIADTNPEYYKLWQSRKSSVFNSGFDQARIDMEEDAIVVEALTQHACLKDTISTGVVRIDIPTIAKLVKE